MQRSTALALAVLLLGAVAWVSLHVRGRPAAPAALTDAGPAASWPEAGVRTHEGDAGGDGDIEAGEEDLEDRNYDDWSRWPDGAPVAPLPRQAPMSVRFGAFLVPYAGAEYAPRDAPPRAEALKTAERLLEIAHEDFELAVEDAHAGAANLGRIQRGVLEPTLEYALFTALPGTIHPSPIDTPRGFWVVKRLE